VLRWLTAGESHGPALVAILEGLPAGTTITTKELAGELARRRAGYGRGARMAFEQDEVDILGGVRHGVTLGSPIAVRVGNSEWPKWETVMSADPVDAAELAGLARAAPLTRPRPGHADLVGMQKYGFDDARAVLERASARETASRVAVGAIARQLLEQLGTQIVSHVFSIGSIALPDPLAVTFEEARAISADAPLHCVDPVVERAMIAEDTRRALDELPDNLLRDIGLIRFSETHCAFGNDHAVVHNNDRLVSAGYEYRRVRRL